MGIMLLSLLEEAETSFVSKPLCGTSEQLNVLH